MLVGVGGAARVDLPSRAAPDPLTPILAQPIRVRPRGKERYTLGSNHNEPTLLGGQQNS